MIEALGGFEIKNILSFIVLTVLTLETPNVKCSQLPFFLPCVECCVSVLSNGPHGNLLLVLE